MSAGSTILSGGNSGVLSRLGPANVQPAQCGSPSGLISLCRSSTDASGGLASSPAQNNSAADQRQARSLAGGPSPSVVLGPGPISLCSPPDRPLAEASTPASSAQPAVPPTFPPLRKNPLLNPGWPTGQGQQQAAMASFLSSSRGGSGSRASKSVTLPDLTESAPVLLSVVGKGSYGTVYKARWRNSIVSTACGGGPVVSTVCKWGRGGCGRARVCVGYVHCGPLTLIVMSCEG